MTDGLAETIAQFKTVYQRLFSDADRPEELETLRHWIDPQHYGAIPLEIGAMDKLLALLHTRDEVEIERYLRSNKRNTICCGYHNMYVRGYCFWLHNETIPDHFGKILSLPEYESSFRPFLSVEESGATTPFFEQLQEETVRILLRCHQVKKEILRSDNRFRHETQDIDVQRAYLLCEADRLDVVRGITNDMKKVYAMVTRIIAGIVVDN